MDDLRIITDIDAVPEGANCAIIIRHADRGGALNQVVRKDEGLTEEGICRARRLGAHLGRFSDFVSFSSPIGRCVDTGLHISDGYGKEKDPVITEFLGMSAPFMVDPRRAYAKMMEVGLLGFVESYVNDGLDRSMVLPCSEGMQMLLSYAIERISLLDGGVGVFVTHDMIITPPMAYYFGYDYKGKGLVPFLDGIVLYRDGEGYVARYDGRILRVSRSGEPMR